MKKLISIYLLLSLHLFAQNDPLLDPITATYITNMRQELYTTGILYTPQELQAIEDQLLEELLIAEVLFDTFNNLSALITFKTMELENYYYQNKEWLQSINKKEKKENIQLQKLKNDYKIIIEYVRKEDLIKQFHQAFEYALSMIPLFGDAGKIYSMQASFFARKLLKEEPNALESQIIMGISVAHLTIDKGSYEVNNLKTTALQLLSDKNIDKIENPLLKYWALCYRSGVQMKTFDSQKAYTDYRRANSIFPNTLFTEIAGIYYSKNAMTGEKLELLTFGSDIYMPYYIDMGLHYRIDDMALLAPFIGVGMRKTFFSSSWFAEAGMKLFYKNFSWDSQFMHAIIPSFSPMSFDLLEFYGRNEFTLNFDSLSISAETVVGKLLFAEGPLNGEELKEKAFLAPALQQNLLFDATIYTDGLNNISTLVDLGLYHLWEKEETFAYLHAKVPMNFDFIHTEFGLAPEIFYTGYLSKNQTTNIGWDHRTFGGAIALNQPKSTDLVNKYYDLYGNIDFIYRIFFQPLPAPADRIYLGIHFNTGFGTTLNTMETDALYAGGISVGFDLYDMTPFEVRFQVDQDGNFSFMFTMVNPIKQKY